MKKKKSNMFFKEYHSDICAMDEEHTKKQELEHKIYITGAFGLYRYLWSRLIRRKWEDSKGYPLKREYYDKGLLACSFSFRKLMAVMDVNNKRLRTWIKLLEEAGWIKIENKTRRGQNVFILGEHRRNDDAYSEILYKNNVEEVMKEGIEDLTTISDEEVFRRKMKEQYGDIVLGL